MGWYQRRVHGEVPSNLNSKQSAESQLLLLQRGYRTQFSLTTKLFSLLLKPPSQRLKQPTRTNQPLAMAVSKIRQNYHEECEALINKQINMEFYASYVYLSMASYFARDDIALHGFAGHFRTESGE